MKKSLLITSTAFALTACVAIVSEPSALVYINSGAIQCESEGKTGAETALLLSRDNIKVTKTECAHISNLVVITMCGGPVANINVHTISSEDLEKALALGFKNITILKQKDHIGFDVNECQ